MCKTVNLQGVFIFCFHCIRSAAVRSEWRGALSKVSTYRAATSRTLRTSTDARDSNSDLQSVRDFLLVVCFVTTLGKLFTHSTLRHQLIRFGACVKACRLRNMWNRSNPIPGSVAHSITVICSPKRMRLNFEKQSPAPFYHSTWCCE